MKLNIEAISALPNGTDPNYLLVVLHGWGANYQDFVPFAKVLNFPGFGYMFPNAPFDHFQVPGGKAWYALENKDFTGLRESRQFLLEWLNSLEAATGVPLAKTIMAGFSQGGAMTLDVGLTLPLAAVCSFSGYLHYQPQASENQTFPPTLIVHGKQDSVVPLEAALKARDELTKIGVTVDYHEFDMAHEVNESALALFKQFITEQVIN
ncbi:MAG: dienelactone hydrolase family protein [Cyanobacteria bacterium P01_G01_bin.39]